MDVESGMHRLLALGSACALATSIACAFDASGSTRGLGVLEEADDDGDDGDDDDDDGPAPEPEPEPEPNDDGRTDAGSADDRGDAGEDTGGLDTSVLEAGEVDEGSADDGLETDDGGNVDAGEVTDDDGGDAGTDDGSALPDCPAEVFELLWAGSADLADPMQLAVAEDAMDSPDVATSTIAEEGSVTFDLHFECPGEYAIWGLVWDYAPGALASDDPDSFYVGVGGPEPTWRYGCTTGEESSGLSWQRLQALQAQPCDEVPVVISVAEPGDVQLTFRNREAGGGSQVAGISAIVIATDVDANPYDLYDPY